MMKRNISVLALILFLAPSVSFADWTPLLSTIAPSTGISRAEMIAWSATNQNTMYAISAWGGLFKSTDGGNNWVVAPATDYLPIDTQFNSVAVDPTNDQIVYVGTGDIKNGDGQGLWKSTDGGQTLSQIFNNSGRLVVSGIAIDPTNHNTIVITTIFYGIWKSTDGGTTWTQTLTQLGASFSGLERGVNANGIDHSRYLYAAPFAWPTGNNNGIYLSTDFGNSWTLVTAGLAIPAGVGTSTTQGTRIGIAQSDPNIIYVAYQVDYGIVFKSNDGGHTFATVKQPHSDPSFSLYPEYTGGIGVDRLNANTLYYVSYKIWKSTNGGLSWAEQGNIHTDIRFIRTNPDNTQLWAGSDGGLYMSTNGGTSFTMKSNGFYGFEVYNGCASPTINSATHIGTQDNSFLFTTPISWVNFDYVNGLLFDGVVPCLFDDQSSTGTVYYFGHSTDSFLPRSTTIGRYIYDGSNGYTSPDLGTPVASTYYSGLAFNRQNPNLAFAAHTDILRTTNLSSVPVTWTQISTIGKQMVVHSQVGNPNILYAMTQDGYFYVSMDALDPSPIFTQKAAPQKVTSFTGGGFGPPDNFGASIASTPTGIVYVSANDHVYRSSDQGTTWTNVTFNLLGVNFIGPVIDEYNNQGLIFIASAGAVYYKKDADTSWTIFNAALPTRVVISSLGLFQDPTNHANDLITAFNYGRGIWRSPFPDTTPPAVSLTAPKGGSAVSGTIAVSASASDNIGVTKVEFYLDLAATPFTTVSTATPTPNPTTFSISWNTVNVSNGMHILTAKAYDSANNSTTSSAVSITVDNIAPTVSLTAPANGATVSGTSVTISALASDDLAIQRVEFYLDGSLLATSTSLPYSIIWDSTKVADGSHSIIVKAYDTAGNSTISVASAITVTNLTVSLVSPTQGSYVKGSVKVSATASSPGGIAKVGFYLDSSILLGTDATLSRANLYSVSWYTTQTTTGSHSLTARAYNMAGASATSAPIAVTVDNVNPMATITSPINGSTVKAGSTVTITAMASDNIGVAKVDFLVNGNVKCTVTTAPYTCNWNVPTAIGNTYKLKAEAFDFAGNTDVSPVVDVISN